MFVTGGNGAVVAVYLAPVPPPPGRLPVPLAYLPFFFDLVITAIPTGDVIRSLKSFILLFGLLLVGLLFVTFAMLSPLSQNVSRLAEVFSDDWF